MVVTNLLFASVSRAGCNLEVMRGMRDGSQLPIGLSARVFFPRFGTFRDKVILPEQLLSKELVGKFVSGGYRVSTATVNLNGEDPNTIVNSRLKLFAKQLQVSGGSGVALRIQVREPDTIADRGIERNAMHVEIYENQSVYTLASYDVAFILARYEALLLPSSRIIISLRGSAGSIAQMAQQSFGFKPMATDASKLIRERRMFSSGIFR